MSHAKEIPIHILILVEARRSRGIKIKNFMERYRISSTTLYTNIYKLMNEGYMRKEGNRYVITEKGIEFLNQVKAIYREIVESI